MRLIDADELRNWIMQNPFASTHEMLDAVYDAPTISAVPMAHGRWELERAGKYKQVEYYSCSICGFDLPYNPEYLPEYCPRCGAKMDLED